MRTPAIELEEGEIHVWQVDPTAIQDPVRLARYAAWMPDDELARQQRFLFPRHRHAFLVARALVRGTLSRYVPAISPEQWRFVIGEHGRPDVDPALGTGSLRFNLSHTDGRAVIALGRAEIGIDVEARGRRGDLRGIAEHFFAAAEVEAIKGLEGVALAERFFATWTLKEAYMKACGVGISLGLGRFWFVLDSAGSIAIRFAPSLVDDPESWSFCRFDVSAEHPVALALRWPRTRPLRVRLFAGLPGERHSIEVVEIEILDGPCGFPR